MAETALCQEGFCSDWRSKFNENPIIWAEQKKELLLFYFFKSEWHKWLKHLGTMVRTTVRIRVANVCVPTGPDHEGKTTCALWLGMWLLLGFPRPSIAKEYCAVYCQLRERKKKSKYGFCL